MLNLEQRDKELLVPRKKREPLSQPLQILGPVPKLVTDVMRQHHENIVPTMRGKAESLRRQADTADIKEKGSGKEKRTQAKRLDALANTNPKPVTLKKAAQNRVQAVEDAATRRVEGDRSLAGAGWYLDAHDAIRGHAPGVDPRTAVTASSVMSPGTKPEREHAALGALVSGVREGKVEFHPDLVEALGSVPEELHGRRVAFGDLPSHLVGQMINKGIAQHVERHSEGIDWKALRSGPHASNVSTAHAIISGALAAEQAQDPATSPKTWSYTHNLAQFDREHSSDAVNEYLARAAHLGDSIRGDIAKGQDMLDLWGQRASNEGILSNQGHTAEDSWMMAVSHNVDHPQMKGMGDVPLTRKRVTGKDRKSKSVVDNPEVTPAGIQHAWENRATHEAAKMLQTKYDTDYTVPSTLVQETAWTSTRRRVGEDSEYNRAVRESAKAPKEQNSPRSQQFELF